MKVTIVRELKKNHKFNRGGNPLKKPSHIESIDF